MKKVSRLLWGLFLLLACVSCQTNTVYEQLCVYDKNGEAISMHIQANENSPTVAMIPSGTSLEKVSWMNRKWVFGSCRVEVKNKSNKKNQKTSFQTFWGYVPRGSVYMNYSFNFRPMPRRNKSIKGWRRKMDDYYEVRGKKPVPIMQNRRYAGEKFGISVYKYDTIGWVQPKTAVRLIEINGRKWDKHGTEYFKTISATDTLQGYMYGAQLKAKKRSLIYKTYWLNRFVNPENDSKILAWKNELFYKWSVYFQNRMYNNKKSFWYRFGWSIIGGLIWIIGTFFWHRKTKIIALIWDVAIPWLYMTIIHDFMWFASPAYVGWWSLLGIPIAIIFIYVFLSRLMSNIFSIWSSLKNGNYLMSIYHIIYATFMAIVCYDMIVGSFEQGVGVLILLFYLFFLFPSAHSGNADSNKGEVMFENGERIGADILGDKAYADDGRIYSVKE